MKLTILNTREVKKIKQIVVAQFGHFVEGKYAFLRNEKNKIFVVNKDISRIALKNLRIDRMGLYFAEVKQNHVRLSKEGAQLLGKRAKQLTNVVELTKEEVKAYFQGEDLVKDLGESKLVILQYNDDILGCAQYKEGKILNFLPKTYRGEVII
jgi:NOL1/NOP2/fmu family ribosome biogenesis protein